MFVFFFFFVYAVHSTRNKTHFSFSFLCTLQVRPAHCTRHTNHRCLSAPTHTHTHAHTSGYAQGNVYIHHKAKQCKVSWPVQASFVCKMKACSQNADKRPAQLDRLAATCSTNAVFGQLKKHQKKKKRIHTRRTLKALTVFHFERASEQRKRELVLWA